MPDKLYRNLQMHRRGTSLQLQMRGTSLQKVLKEVLIVPPCKRSSWTRSARANDCSKIGFGLFDLSNPLQLFYSSCCTAHIYTYLYIYTYNIYTLSRPGASGPVVDEATTFRISVTTFTVSSVSEEGQDSSPTACCKAAGCGMLVPVDLGRSAMQVRSISWLLPFFCAVELSICTIYLMHQCVRIPYHYNADLPDKSYRKLQMHRRC